MINETVLLKTLNDMKDKLLPDEEGKHLISIESIINLVENFNHTDFWIPCEVMSPYLNGRPMKSILVTMLDCEGKRFTTNTLDRRATKDNKVIAWLPMPQPYQG